MPINEIHARLGSAALLFMIIAGVWGLLRWARKQPIDSNYFGILVVGELLLIAQALVGAYMLFILGGGANLERANMHVLYGFLTAIALPALYAYTRGQTETHREQGMYAFMCLTLAALVWRAMVTSAPAVISLAFLL